MACAPCAAFRQKTLLPLDDVLGCQRDAIPNLSRSALHRCLQRHGISRLPVEAVKDQRKRFKTYEIGYVEPFSADRVARLSQQRRRPHEGSSAELHHAATDVDREDNTWQRRINAIDV